MFEFYVPCVFLWLGSEWQVGTGEPNGYKSITAFYPQEATNSNGILEVHLYFYPFASSLIKIHTTNCYQFVAAVSVVITGLGPDFTKMESFGKVDEFAETLV